MCIAYRKYLLNLPKTLGRHGKLSKYLYHLKTNKLLFLAQHHYLYY
jgi:hypothetical protein